MSDTQRASDSELGAAPLMPLIAKYAIPSVISMLVGAAYNLTDQIFIGHVVGVVGNAASNVVFPTVTYFSATDNPRQGLLVSLSRQGLFLIPLLIILPRYLGIQGILIASPISDTLAFIVSVSMVIVSFRKFETEKKV